MTLPSMGITPADIQRSFDVPLNNYLVNVDYAYTHVGAIVADVEFPSLLSPEEFYTQSPSARLQEATENADSVWVFSLPNVPIQSDLLALNTLLLDAGYTYCGAVVDRSDLLGTLYTRDASMCQQIITSCSEN
ncbi:MAG: hypothetical protein Q9P01_08055 [Anaerolineae bacterium]|nr:hypothetical protein [Anaerolineae bacterium]